MGDPVCQLPARMLPMAWLTKSRFVSGLQCHKRLWSEIHAPIDEPTPEQVNFINGRAVDELVQKLQPGTVISRKDGMPSAIAETARVMDADSPERLYQPAFRSGNFAVIADVLRRQANGYSLVEVKSSTKVKPEHLPDAAYQTYVLRQAGIPVASVHLAHVDNTFVLRAAGDYAGLITEEDITTQVESMLPGIADTASQYLSIMNSATRPAVAMSGHCSTPYDCPFIERCSNERGAAPDYPVTILPHGGKTVDALVADGYEDLSTVPGSRLRSPLHQRVHEATVSGHAYFDPHAANALREHTFPRAHLDFETMGFAIPEIIGSRPYEQLPFQFSVHVEHTPDKIDHHEFLALDTFGDFGLLAERLLAAIPPAGPIFAYNAHFEARVIQQLANRLPTQRAALLALNDRLVDLLPIARAAYYHRDMRGSWSIKAVLPTIAAALDYANLTDVQAGESAQLAFLEARQLVESAPRRQHLTQALLSYCKHDTWAMIVLRRFLCGESLPA
jgi:hypothetical protein